MLISEMISDEEKAQIIQLINQCLINQIPQSQKPNIKDRVQRAYNDKIKNLINFYHASDIQNKLRVSDEDKVIARRAYLDLKTSQ